MKNKRNHILLAWILLLCFTAGQYMVYGHRHTATLGGNRSARHLPLAQSRHTLSENCKLCDAMHHYSMALSSPLYFVPVTVTRYSYKNFKYAFVSISIVRGAGRSPPLA